MDSASSRAPGRNPSPVVLIADNDEGVSAVLSVVLDREGMGVTTVRNGEDAFEALKRGGIDAFVCDLDMPKMSGEELLGELQSWESAPPIVVISGFLDTRLEERLGALRHVHAVLRKPFDVFGFGAQLRELVLHDASAASDEVQQDVPQDCADDMGVNSAAAAGSEPSAPREPWSLGPPPPPSEENGASFGREKGGLFGA